MNFTSARPQMFRGNVSPYVVNAVPVPETFVLEVIETANFMLVGERFILRQADPLAMHQNGELPKPLFDDRFLDKPYGEFIVEGVAHLNGEPILANMWIEVNDLTPSKPCSNTPTSVTGEARTPIIELSDLDLHIEHLRGGLELPVIVVMDKTFGKKMVRVDTKTGSYQCYVLNESDTFVLLNTTRAEAGAPPLEIDTRITHFDISPSCVQR